MTDTPEPEPTTPATPQNIHQAIHAVKAALALHGVAKSGQNKEQNYQFRSVDDVVAALSELFVQHRINVVPRMVHSMSVERGKTQRGAIISASFVDAEFDLVSVDDGTSVTFKACGEGADMSDKGTNKAMSAAFKYAMTLGFVIPTKGVLDEGDSTTPAAEEQQQDSRRGNGRGRDDDRGDRGNDRNSGRQRNGQNQAQQMKAWVDRQITDFESYKQPSDFNRLSAHADDDEYRKLKRRVIDGDAALGRKLSDAEREAYSRCDDVPF